MGLISWEIPTWVPQASTSACLCESLCSLKAMTKLHLLHTKSIWCGKKKLLLWLPASCRFCPSPVQISNWSREQQVKSTRVEGRGFSNSGQGFYCDLIFVFLNSFPQLLCVVTLNKPFVASEGPGESDLGNRCVEPLFGPTKAGVLEIWEIIWWP